MSAIALDPLIAEAKARAHRRRLIALGLIVVAAAVVLGVTLGTRSASVTSPLGRLDAAARDDVQMVQVQSGNGVTSAVDAQAGIWLTTDDGRTWRKTPLALGPGSPTPDFVDRLHGWGFTATFGRLDRTVDGGRTWQQLPPLPGRKSFGSVSVSGDVMAGPSFVSRTVGFVEVLPAESEHDELFATHDGGTTWQPRVLPADARLGGFVNPLKGFAFGGNRIYSTADGARTWSVLFRARHGCAGSLVALGGTLVLACTSGPPKRLSFYVSHDDGSTWSERPGSVPLGALSTVSARTWVVVTLSGRMFVTTSAGSAWRLVHPQGVPPQWKLYLGRFTSSRVGWAIFRREVPRENGPGAVYRRCIAAGRSRGSCLGDRRYRELDFASQRGVLMRTTDGGLHWTPAGPPKPKASKQG